jgi:tetratricopeptide (TPR) repeat protein
LARLQIPVPRSSQTVVISAIDGTAGIGKTALAVYWAHSVRHLFTDGQLYVNLRGFDPGTTPLAPAEALQMLLEGLGVPPDQVPAVAETRAALYRSLLSGRRVLVVLDNAAETTQVEPLLPGDGPCMTVVTSRNRLDGLIVHRGAERIALDVLTPSEARALMASHLGEERLAAERRTVEELAARCDHLPLALTIVAARAASYPSFPLRALVDELRDERHRLDALDTGDLTTNIRAVFSWSYRRLPAATARVFRLLGLHAGPGVGLAAAAALAGMSEQQTRQHLSVLARAHLVEQHMPHRFRFHDLLRVYAAERASEDETASDQHSALRRMLDSYLHCAHNASRQLNTHRPTIPIEAPQPGAVISQFTVDDDAMRWFQEEYENLLATVEWAAAHDFGEYAWRLALAFWQYLYLCGRWYEMIAIHETVLPAADAASEKTAAPAVHANLGVSEAQLGNYQAAVAHFRKALDGYYHAGDLDGQGNALDSLAWVEGMAGHFPEAVDWCEQALTIYRQTGDRDGEARALDSLGVAHAGLGQYEQAIDYGRQALELHIQTANRIGQAHTLHSLGRCHAQAGDYDRAVVHYQEALGHCREITDRQDEANNLRDLGVAFRELGRFAEARTCWQDALTILTELHHPGATILEAELATLPSLPPPA